VDEPESVLELELELEPPDPDAACVWVDADFAGGAAVPDDAIENELA
jgi:hypothetical protein